ncbi:MAG TPA: peptidoglycan-associated lipoprotein Pal [Dongiaceae bacterium]|nr:peptidoglycan-associated lipoprotein Pal [Dongiaceae bacterium]
MTSRLMPALCAALLLAACDTTGGGDKPAAEAPAPQLAGTEAGIGGISSSTDPLGGLSSIGDTVYFDTDSYSLTPQAQATLQKQAAWLQQNRQRGITVEGHADERGTREYNLALGERRAQTVLNYLSALGVDAGRLKEVSYGKERPVCPDSTEACWSKNRRGVTTVDN